MKTKPILIIGPAESGKSSLAKKIIENRTFTWILARFRKESVLLSHVMAPSVSKECLVIDELPIRLVEALFNIIDSDNRPDMVVILECKKPVFPMSVLARFEIVDMQNLSPVYKNLVSQIPHLKSKYE